MNRYPLWKNATVLIALVLGLLYTLPNFFGEVPAVQVASVKSTHKVDTKLLAQVEAALKAASIAPQGVSLDLNSVRVRLADTDTQLKARDAIEKALNPVPADAAYSVALNLVSNSPNWLTGINALPMYLGLDLRGGVHFLLQVDMKGALTKRLDSVAADLRTLLREKNLRHAGIARSGQAVQVQFRDAEMRDKAKQAIASSQPELQLAETLTGADFTLVATLRPEAIKTFQDDALKQNIATLNKRINELAVAEPVIQQQGADRIVVQLPGVQDVARAKDLIGRTATLEVRLVEQASVAGSDAPVGTDLIPERRRDGSINMVAVRKLVVLTGDRFNGAQATFDENQRPAVAVQLDAAGGRIMRDVTRENLKKMMAIILIEKGKAGGDFGGHHPGRVRQPLPDHRHVLPGRNQYPGDPDPLRGRRRADGHHRGTGNRPQPRRRQHRQGLQFHAVGFRRHLAVHGGLLPAVRFRLGVRPVGQPAVPGGAAVAAAGHADPAGHRCHRADARHGDRRQRADQRAGARGTAQRQFAAGIDHRRLRAGLGDHSRLEHHHPDRRGRAADLRFRAGARLSPWCIAWAS
jgi:hypothetical protein